MYSTDDSQPRNFVGIEYAANMRGPSVYNMDVVTSSVLQILEEYFREKQFTARERRPPLNMGSAATGSPQFYEILQWIRDNWSFLEGAATVLLAQVAIARSKLYLLKKKMDERVINPYKPSVVIELYVLTEASRGEGENDAVRSFRSVLVNLPELSVRLNCQFPTQKFTIRVTGGVYSHASVYFKVAQVRQSDVAKIVRRLSKIHQTEVPRAILLYRRFQLFTGLKVSKNTNDFVRFNMQ